MFDLCGGGGVVSLVGVGAGVPMFDLCGGGGVGSLVG